MAAGAGHVLRNSAVEAGEADGIACVFGAESGFFVRCAVEVVVGAQEGGDGPGFDLAALAGPRGHAGVTDAMPRDPPQFAVGEVEAVERRGRGHHLGRDRVARDAGRAMAGGAAGGEVSGAKADQAGIVEIDLARHLLVTGPDGDGVAHVLVQDLAHAGPVRRRRGDGVGGEPVEGVPQHEEQHGGKEDQAFHAGSPSSSARPSRVSAAAR